MCLNPSRFASRDYQPTPCGKCIECKKRDVHSWSFRLMQEEKQAISSLFVTLTYNDENVPYTRTGKQSLYKRDCQLFFKRLRKARVGKESNAVKYFICGEYGGRTQRPHYHSIIFNAEVSDIEAAWTVKKRSLGHIHYGSVSDASVYYTTKYMVKNSGRSFRANDSREREFRLMSKGVGEAYCQDLRFIHWHKADIKNRMYCNLPGGKKISMPRYYKDRIYTDEEREEASYASLLKAQAKPMVSQKQKEEQLLAGYFAMEFERRSRSAV